MKKIIPLLTVLLALGCATQPPQASSLQMADIIFDNPENLPGNVIIDDELYEKTGQVILVLKDYPSHYSRIVLYDTINQTFTKEIYTPTEGVINEFAYNDGVLVFSVLLEEGGKSVHNIYCLERDDFQIKNIARGVNRAGGNYPLSLSTAEGRIVWVFHDFESERSGIDVYTLSSETTDRILSSPFTGQRLQIPLFFCSLEGSKLLFDLIESNSLMVKVIDLDTRQEDYSLRAIEGADFHFTGALDWEDRYVVLYSVTNQGTLVYRMDLNSKRTQPLFGLSESSYLYNDLMILEDHKLHYVVQLVASGPIDDHYYYEVYDLSTLTMNREMSYFDLFKSEKYTGLLKFLDGYLKIGLEIYQN